MFEYIFSSAGRRVVAAGQKRADRIYAFKVANIFFNALSARCPPMNVFFLFLLLLLLPLLRVYATVTSLSRRRTLPEASGKEAMLFFSKKFAFAYL